MDEKEHERLQEQYPAWRIRKSANERCVLATRLDRLNLTPAELYAGLCMTLIEDSPDSLALALANQAEKEGAL
jgi:hypothetical protein